MTHERLNQEELGWILKLLTNNNDYIKKVGPKFRSKARELPTMVAVYGLVESILYLASKGGIVYQQNLESIVNYGNKNGEVKLKDEKAAAIALWIIAKIMHERLGVKDRGNDLFTLEGLFKEVSKLANEDKAKLEYISQRLIPYLVVVKRFAEAMYEKEKGGG